MKKHKAMIVTHARPHLDDVTAAWLLKKFHPKYYSGSVRFLTRGADGNFKIPKGAVAVGIGRGQFDEHKGDLNDCAASLVWKWLKSDPQLAFEPSLRRAIDQLVDYVLQGDLGKLNAVPWRAWSIGDAFFGYGERVGHNNTKVYKFGVELLESVLVGLYRRVTLDLEWDNRIEFSTPWGMGMGIETTNSDVFGRAYEEGFVLVCRINPEKGYRQIRADALSDVDLTNAYARVKKLEPNNQSWFLHHSNHLLLCGSSSANNFTPSRLTLEALISLVKK